MPQTPVAASAPTPKSPEGASQRILTEADFGKMSYQLAEEGLMACFEKGTHRTDKVDDHGNPVLAYCEVSAAVALPHTIYFASDKEIPGDERSSVFSVQRPGRSKDDNAAPYVDVSSVTHFSQTVYQHLRKAEDFALSQDGQTVFLTSGFDRIKTDSTKWHGYNTLMALPAGKPDQAYVVNAHTNPDGSQCSVGLRKALSRALANSSFPEGMPYFKVESLVALPGQTLLFGIREMGQRFDDFSYTITLVEAPYTKVGGQIRIHEEKMRMVFQMPKTVLLGHEVALSSLDYDAHTDMLYFLLSYEEETKNIHLGGFLFRASRTNILSGEPFAPNEATLAHWSDGTLLHFGHKPEAVTLLHNKMLLVAADDDRVLEQKDPQDAKRSFSKEPHEAAYFILKEKTH